MVGGAVTRSQHNRFSDDGRCLEPDSTMAISLYDSNNDSNDKCYLQRSRSAGAAISPVTHTAFTRSCYTQSTSLQPLHVPVERDHDSQNYSQETPAVTSNRCMQPLQVFQQVFPQRHGFSSIAAFQQWLHSFVTHRVATRRRHCCCT